MEGRGVVFQMGGTSFLRGGIGFDGGGPPTLLETLHLGALSHLRQSSM